MGLTKTLSNAQGILERREYGDVTPLFASPIWSRSIVVATHHLVDGHKKMLSIFGLPHHIILKAVVRLKGKIPMGKCDHSKIGDKDTSDRKKRSSFHHASSNQSS
ncbi:hypothetical protein ACJX0J_011312 [Zea mays]